MKEHLFKSMTILMAAILSVGFAACGDDDDSKQDEKKTATSIIGTWRYTWDVGARSYTAYSFFDDGTGLMFDKGNSAERFTYFFNSETKIVDIKYSDYDKEQMTISQITSNTLVMDGDEYKKAELTNDMLILGEWYLHVDARNSTGKGTRVVFNADWDVKGTGTYEAKDYYNDDAATDEWDYSFFGLSGKVSGTWSITDKRLSIKGTSQIAGEYIIEGLVVNGCRLVRASHPDEYPYLVGEWHQR